MLLRAPSLHPFAEAGLFAFSQRKTTPVSESRFSVRRRVEHVFMRYEHKRQPIG